MKIAPLSGFPEWLPQDRIIEDRILDTLRRTFELHDFSGIKTRTAEPLDQLLCKDEISKETYVLSRLQSGPSQDSEMGLHFDLTVPLARYVLEYAGKLDFPFKRYQIQKAWRGERPQNGRFHEFVQADVDVVGEQTLPFHNEAELPLVMVDALSGLPIPRVVIRASNRKIAQGFHEAVGIEDVGETLRIVDKLDKIGPAAVTETFVERAGTTSQQVDLALRLADVLRSDASVADRVRELGQRSDLLGEGPDELVRLVEGANTLIPGSVVADLKITRGLDYYTGSVYEPVPVGHEDLGPICSGGRYDSFVSDDKRTYSDVGPPIGVSRFVSRLIGKTTVSATREVPTCVLIAVNDEDARAAATATAMKLRRRGIPADVSPTAVGFDKQIKFTDRRGIPFVWFSTDEGGQVRDIRTGEQVEADPDAWVPESSDYFPQLKETKRVFP